jgi:hypothetical protein
MDVRISVELFLEETIFSKKLGLVTKGKLYL